MKASATTLLLGLGALGLTSCRACADEPPARDARVRTLATLPGPIDALAAGRGVLFAVSRTRGVVFTVAEDGEGGGGGREIATGERDPFAVVARAGKPVWASHAGVIASDEYGKGRRALVDEATVRALGAGPHDVLFSDERGIWRVEWPASTVAVRVVPDVVADEVVASVETVLWLDRSSGSAWSFDLKSGARKELASALKSPRDLSLAGDGHSVSWHEGEGGGATRAFLADTVTGAVRELAGSYASGSDYVIKGSCLLGAGACKPVTHGDWIVLDRAAGDGRVAFDSATFYWAALAQDGDWRVESAPIVACCP